MARVAKQPSKATCKECGKQVEISWEKRGNRVVVRFPDDGWSWHAQPGGNKELYCTECFDVARTVEVL